MSARGRLLAARLRDERGFGMVELLAAMTVMVVGLLAVFGLFQAGMVQIRRASTETTAAALADAEMENFRALEFTALGIDSTQTCASGCSAADAVYRADAAYKADTAPVTSLATSVTSSATTITVASATGFPAKPEFRVKVENEIMLVTAVGSPATTWTVSRAQDGTTAAAHATGAAVTLKQRADVPSCASSTPAPDPCSTISPTVSSTGADGHAYRVDTYVNWTPVAAQDGTAGRAVKQITLVVRDSSAPYHEWARVTSIFDSSTGQ
jgi:Tfp pilus assembly protein PilV